jgi:2-polyprenyl-3-methyl-5-hydroxy-6-metoxy-1,4-benzoquinol methylase
MPFFLPERNVLRREKMDDPDCSKKALYKTYRRFAVVNAVISGWKRIYRSRIRPLAAKNTVTLSLLDIGFGGGDIPLKLAKWAVNDGLNLKITAVDTDSRAVDYSQQLPCPGNISFLESSSAELVEQEHLFDVVISNHLLHHLSEEQLPGLLNDAQKLARKMVVFNDIKRSDIAYGLFKLASRPLSRDSFITHDGLVSIKRSYTFQELRDTVPAEWKVEQMFPYRLLLSYRHE